MLTFNAQGLGRRALRATLFGMAAFLSVLAVGLAANPITPPAQQIVLVGYGSSSPEPALGATGSPVGAQTQTNGTFTIAGNVAGMYPGLTAPMVLTVSNPKPFSIVVTSITTTIGDANAACSASNLTVTAFSGQLLVPGLGSAATTVHASMAKSAGDPCQGATFPLVYNGLASKP